MTLPLRAGEAPAEFTEEDLDAMDTAKEATEIQYQVHSRARAACGRPAASRQMLSASGHTQSAIELRQLDSLSSQNTHCVHVTQHTCHITFTETRYLAE